ncbi:uncharacterized protein LOC126900510 [Daktulosphaira vitifoliae]|uniref:uncharacterized protein LOC126900510 n=1 Tax=Daktulosphaira vitifoliae TaxID=58002 RepID=UPI0021AA8A2A|nr:uncharacterized protein LOC126900510 [Daktulosphaira vitifoliae]
MQIKSIFVCKCVVAEAENFAEADERELFIEQFGQIQPRVHDDGYYYDPLEEDYLEAEDDEYKEEEEEIEDSSENSDEPEQTYSDHDLELLPCSWSTMIPFRDAFSLQPWELELTELLQNDSDRFVRRLYNDVYNITLNCELASKVPALYYRRHLFRPISNLLGRLEEPNRLGDLVRANFFLLHL